MANAGIERRSGGRAVGFAVAVTLICLFLYLFSPFNLVVLGWALEPYTDVNGVAPISHRVHEVSFGVLFAFAMSGALSQLRRPHRNVAGMQQLLIVTVVFLTVVSLSTGFEWIALAYLAPALIATALHPARRDVLLPRFHPHLGLVMLTLFAAFPLIDMAQSEFAKALAGARNHHSHWGAMAAFAIAILALALLASLRPDGWRVPAWSAALGTIVYAVVSVAHRFDASARPSLWAVMATLWALGFLVLAEGARAAEVAGGSRRKLRELRRTERRVVGGVVGGLARSLGLRPLVMRVLLVVPLLALGGSGIGGLMGVAIGLLGYGAAWVVIPDERVDVVPVWRRRALPVFVVLGLVVPSGSAFLAASGGLWVAGNTPQVVPHVVEAITRAHCVDCHATGKEGATLTDHPAEVCTEDCFLDSPDCVGCHQVNPDLVTAREGELVEPAIPLERWLRTAAGDPLGKSQLAELASWARAP